MEEICSLIVIVSTYAAAIWSSWRFFRDLFGQPERELRKQPFFR